MLKFIFLALLQFQALQFVQPDYPSQKFLETYKLLEQEFEQKSTSKINNYPVIGIYALPSQFPKLYNASEYTFIGASYVNWIHAAGARVIPISSHSSQETLQKLFNQVNGILFTGQEKKIQIILYYQGGASDLVVDGEWTQYANNVMYLISLAKQANDQGDYFPIWGTCMGFEALAVAISGNKTLLTKVEDLNRHGNITFVNRNESIIYQNLTDTLASHKEQFLKYIFRLYGNRSAQFF